jgi:protocatechuate 3,4-dioxygenase beta subunit
MDGPAADRGAGQGAGADPAADLRARLALAGPDRLAEAVRCLADHAVALIDALSPTEGELDALVQFLTDVGYATDARRQEWVLLADVFGLSAMVAEAAASRVRAGGQAGGTPATLRGPFYRADAPLLPSGADLSRDGVGTPLAVRVRVAGPDGAPVAGAEVEVWHANGAGLYENQDPDGQPEHNLRGRFVTDAAGACAFRSVRPAGYRLPSDGPVGQLALRLGLSLDRPAHIHFAVAAPGFRRLCTAVFDGEDPAIGRDALFAVRPALIGHYRPEGAGLSLDVALVLARDATSAPTTQG